MKKSLLAALLVIGLFSGCSEKELEYNKPAGYWYEKMTEAVGRGDLDDADDYFSSLQSEHVGSILLPEAMLILAQAHMQHDEYLLAGFYFDEYLKRFGTSEQKETVEFFKIKSKFLAFKYPKRDQQLLGESIAAARVFIQTYPHSRYVPAVKSMLTRFYLGQEVVDREIVALYKRMNEPQAAKFYEEQMRRNPIDWKHVEPVEQSFIRGMFEGTGGESWLDDVVPRHKIDRGIDFMNDDESWFNRFIHWDWDSQTDEMIERETPVVQQDSDVPVDKPQLQDDPWYYYLNPMNWWGEESAQEPQTETLSEEQPEVKEEQTPAEETPAPSKEQQLYGEHGSDEGITIEVEEGTWMEKLNPMNWFK